MAELRDIVRQCLYGLIGEVDDFTAKDLKDRFDDLAAHELGQIEKALCEISAARGGIKCIAMGTDGHNTWAFGMVQPVRRRPIGAR